MMGFKIQTGDPNNPNSLHYKHPQMDNQYSLAIKAVGKLTPNEKIMENWRFEAEE